MKQNMPQSSFILSDSSLLFSVFLLLCTLGVSSSGQTISNTPPATFDVIHYDARVEPNIANKSVTGRVSIKFISRIDNLTKVELDCGELVIDLVRAGKEAQRFTRLDRRVSIALSHPAKAGEAREIDVEYHGTPRRGIRFFPEQDQVYTVFSTSQWLVCVDAPDDKATLHLILTVPAGLSVVANGRLVGQNDLPNKRTAYEWRQEHDIPTYIFGFAVGHFRTVTEQHGRLQLRYLATQFSDEELRRIFHDTGDMIDFYQDRAGLPYADAVYTQVLAAGGVEQEMSSFTAMRETYGREVLANEHAIWLGAHELSHQWWGNMVTCRDWTHFWLNEGMANFMTAAYLEHRFGRQEYLRQIEEYRASYEKVRAAGKDRSLVFPDWLHPTSEDRTLVYDKGAYVLHLLRQELGERAFWAGIRHYTKKYFGKSVTTTDFETAMEEASGKNLKRFFAEWIEKQG